MKFSFKPHSQTLANCSDGLSHKEPASQLGAKARLEEGKWGVWEGPQRWGDGGEGLVVCVWESPRGARGHSKVGKMKREGGEGGGPPNVPDVVMNTRPF